MNPGTIGVAAAVFFFLSKQGQITDRGTFLIIAAGAIWLGIGMASNFRRLK